MSDQTPDETFEALRIVDAAALSLVADPRLHLGAEGTIELWLAASETQPPITAAGADRGLTILQHGDAATGVDWRVALEPDGHGIRFEQSRSGPTLSRRFRFAGGDYRHIAFVTAGGRTHVVIDGSTSATLDEHGVPESGAEIGYLPATPAGRPLLFGGEGDTPTAHVWISSVRLWDRALDAGDLRFTAQSIGLPAGRPDLLEHLAAYSLFTSSRKEIRLTRPEVLFADFGGGSDGEDFLYRRPGGQRLASVYVLPDGPGAIADVMVEFDGPERDLGLTDGDLDTLSLPTVLPRRGSAPSLERAAILRGMVEDVARALAAGPGAVDEGTVSAVRQRFLDARSQARRDALGFDDQGGISNFGELPGSAAPYHAWRVLPRRQDGVRRLSGLDRGDGIGALKLETRFSSPDMVGDTRHGGEPFTFVLPEGAVFEGITCRRSEGRVVAMALAYSRPDHPAAEDRPHRATRGVWVDRDAPEPTRFHSSAAANDGSGRVDGPAEIHGTYRDQEVYRIRYTPERSELTLSVVRLGHDPAVEDHVFLHAVGERWDETGGRHGQLFLNRDRIHWIGADEVYERVLVRPAPYQPPDEDKLPWGATFSLDQRPSAVMANFLGYFPYRMLARDYEATTGADKVVFAYPDDDSKDYSTTGAHILVPHGFFFRRDNKGSERTRSKEIRSATERQESWGFNLGLKAGVGKLFSFNEDFSYQNEQEGMHAEEQSLLMNRAIATHYALVVDLTRVDVSADFRDRVSELRDRHVLGLGIDWRAFFRSFGTHYPYAVTYGGMAWMESFTDKVEASHGSTTSVEAKAEAEGTFARIFKVGGKVGGTASEGGKKSGESQTMRSVFGTYGGSFSRGDGWSLGRGEELPLLLDLRPIHELLTPLFFDDPAIWSELRDNMVREFDAYTRALERSALANHSWASAIRVDTGDRD